MGKDLEVTQGPINCMYLAYMSDIRCVKAKWTQHKNIRNLVILELA